MTSAGGKKKPLSTITIDVNQYVNSVTGAQKTAREAAISSLEDSLSGTQSSEPTLPSPDAVFALLYTASTVTTYDTATEGL